MKYFLRMSRRNKNLEITPLSFDGPLIAALQSDNTVCHYCRVKAVLPDVHLFRRKMSFRFRAPGRATATRRSLWAPTRCAAGKGFGGGKRKSPPAPSKGKEGAKPLRPPPMPAPIDEVEQELGSESLQREMPSLRPPPDVLEEMALVDDALKQFREPRVLSLARSAGFHCSPGSMPRFHLEYDERDCWPACVDVEACRRFLWSSYDDARGTLTYNFERLQAGSQHPGLNESIYQRLGNNADAMRWFESAPFGDIREITPEPYEPKLLQDFSNAVNLPQRMVRGSAHVAIGFVDLGSLREAQIEGKPSAGPLTWAGFEASAFCVAKNVVIAAMLAETGSSSPEAVDNVLEVWYSSVLSPNTLAALRRALLSIEHGGADTTGGRSRDSDVEGFLQHWAKSGFGTSGVPLAAARFRWLSATRSSWADISELVQPSDRLAMCDYILTGELPLGQSQDGRLGSPTMFSSPLGCTGRQAPDEVFLFTIEQRSLLVARAAGAADIVAAGVAHLRARVAALAAAVSCGDIQIYLHRSLLKPIPLFTPLDGGLFDAVQYNPATVSWSNVPDYLTARDFHIMASKFSGATHSLYSMNWSGYVKGASITDWMYRDDEEALRKEMHAAATTIKQQIAVVGTVGGARIFNTSPNLDLFNAVDWHLRAKPGSFHTAWAAWFRSQALSDQIWSILCFIRRRGSCFLAALPSCTSSCGTERKTLTQEISQIIELCYSVHPLVLIPTSILFS